MGVNVTNFDYALKSLWPQSRVNNLAYKENPLLAMVPKDTKFGGANRIIGVRYSDTQGRSATFATAQTNAGNHAGVKFTVTRAKDYAVAQLTNEVIEASDGDENALLSAGDGELDTAYNNLTRSAAVKMYRDGSGWIGRRASASTNVITLSSTADVSNFEVNQTVVASDTKTGGSLRSGSTTIAGVDRDAGTITLTSAAAITSFADNDYLYVQGDYDAAIKGLDAWLPTTAPSATTFFGVDRSVDTTRLGGVRFTGTSLNPEEALYKASSKVGKEGGTPRHCFMSWDDWNNLQISLGSKVIFEDLSVGEVGFQAIRINGPKGPIRCFPDVNCPAGFSYLLTLSTWKFATLNAFPHIQDSDGNKGLRQATSDGIEYRLVYYGQFYCDAPGWNAVVSMPT